MPEPGPRKRDAAATRAAILSSARIAFAAWGYDGAGVREIAAGAGVTAMLVNRYFGSKEQLFAEVIETTKEQTAVLTPLFESGASGAVIARALVEITDPARPPLDGFLIALRSAASPRAAEIGRAAIEQSYQNAIDPKLSGKRAAERAAIVLALVAGVQVMRQMLALPALAKAKPEDLVEILGPILQSLIDGPKAAA